MSKHIAFFYIQDNKGRFIHHNSFYGTFESTDYKPSRMEFMVEADAVEIAQLLNKTAVLRQMEHRFHVYKEDATITEIALPEVDWLKDRPAVEIEDEEAPEGSGVREPQPEDEVKLENPEADVEIED